MRVSKKACAGGNVPNSLSLLAGHEAKVYCLFIYFAIVIDLLPCANLVCIGDHTIAT